MADKFDPEDDLDALFDHNYLRWFNLQGQPALVQITSVKRGVELTLRGGAKKKGAVLELKQIQGSIDNLKPLVLNVTNGESIAKFLGRKPKDWVGKQIVLYQDETKLKGEVVPCIRVRPPKASTTTKESK